MSLVAINANSPYKVKVAQADDTLCFITDFDAEIFVTFERDDILQNGLVYQFGISNPKGVKQNPDSAVSSYHKLNYRKIVMASKNPRGYYWHIIT